MAFEFRRAVDQFCDTIAQGHWALFVIVLVTVAAYVPSERGYPWGVSRRTLRHGRLLSYQLAHANLAHLSGNMATLLAVGSEVSEALDCDQLRLLALYVACGWFGGLASALLSEANTIGASGAVSGVIVRARCAPTRRYILGDVNAANPLMLLLGTLGADLTRGRGISWQAHPGGVAGCVIAWLYTLPRAERGERRMHEYERQRAEAAEPVREAQPQVIYGFTLQRSRTRFLSSSISRPGLRSSTMVYRVPSPLIFSFC